MLGSGNLSVNKNMWSVTPSIGELVAASAPALFARFGDHPLSPELVGEAVLAATEISVVETAKVADTDPFSLKPQGTNEWQREIQTRGGFRTVAAAHKPLIVVRFRLFENEFKLAGRHQSRVDLWEEGNRRFGPVQEVVLPRASNATEIGEAMINIAKSCKSVFGSVFSEER
ncbi:hypothetical protein [Maricaulis sp.]|uniref:hypothetical protein n=1 Tax=Maricaulis sp. TaxID=1486257 RepID=UPI001B11D576|nr:hypothetical protein [Maricaulis sp.]MBO6798189.1 hypothetical protein [Maricaulis sp.]